LHPRVTQDTQRITTTPKANAAFTSPADTDGFDYDDFGSLGIYGKPH
jgi:hypothetical protein